MLRRLILVSGLIAAGTLGFAGRASAQQSQQATATFSGGVGSACVLGTDAAAGATVVNDDLEDFPNTLSYDTINFQFTGSLGTPIDIACSGGNLDISVAEDQKPTAETDTPSVSAVVSDGTNTGTVVINTDGSSTTDSFTVANGATQLTVDLTSTFTAAPEPGTYSYIVTLTGTAAQ